MQTHFSYLNGISNIYRATARACKVFEDTYVVHRGRVLGRRPERIAQPIHEHPKRVLVARLPKQALNFRRTFFAADWRRLAQTAADWRGRRQLDEPFGILV